MQVRPWSAVALLLWAVLLVATHPLGAEQSYAQVATIALPNVPPAKGAFSFDISWVDPGTHRYFLADRTNNGIDVIDTLTNTYLFTLAAGHFRGWTGHAATSGPDGIVVLPRLHQIWAGDGDSTVKVVDLRSGLVVATVPTGGTRRADELAYDPRDHLVMIANDADTPPFLTFISTTRRTVVGKIPYPQATNGLEQPVWDPADDMFYQNVPATTAHPGGEVDRIDPATMRVVATYPLTDCMPAGLALGPARHLLVGCSGDAIDAGARAQTLVMDARTGRIVATITQVGGSDEVGYNPGDHHYYVAANHMTSTGLKGGARTPVLGIIDASTNAWIANVPTSAASHSVAADPATNRVFVPLPSGIGVYVRQ
jgi:DNA-binding beta-propeller fold protein YncE